MQEKLSFIKIEGHRIHYRDLGEGPVVLFGHSYLWDLHMWDGVVEKMSVEFRCIVPDLAGHGRSGQDVDFSLEGYADLMHKFLVALGVSQFSVVGLSIGAMWGAYLVDKLSDGVQSFVILNSSLTPEPDKTRILYQGMLQAVKAKQAMPEDIIQAISPGFFSPELSKQRLFDFQQNLRQIPQENINTIVQVGCSFVERGNLLDKFSGYVGRLCVIAGLQDAYRSQQEALEIAEKFSLSVQTVNAGHISVLECESEIVELLQSILR